MTPVKSPHYVMVVDKKTSDILTALLGTATLEIGTFHRYLKRLNVSSEEMLAFFREAADKQHEMNWCDDPHCEDKNSKTT